MRAGSPGLANHRRVVVDAGHTSRGTDEPGYNRCVQPRSAADVEHAVTIGEAEQRPNMPFQPVRQLCQTTQIAGPMVPGFPAGPGDVRIDARSTMMLGRIASLLFITTICEHRPVTHGHGIARPSHSQTGVPASCGHRCTLRHGVRGVCDAAHCERVTVVTPVGGGRERREIFQRPTVFSSPESTVSRSGRRSARSAATS